MKKAFPDGAEFKRYEVRGERGQWLATVFLARRRDGTMSRDEAREEYDHADVAREDFRDWYAETKIEDAREFYVTKPDAQTVAFVEVVMPRLRDMLRTDLAAEKKAA